MMRTEDGWDTTRERILTSEKFQVRRLKIFSYEDRVPELHTWLADRIVTVSRSQQSTRQEDRFEESPHDAKSSL